MACGLVHVSYSLPKWQAVKVKTDFLCTPFFGKTCKKMKQIWIWIYIVVKLKNFFYILLSYELSFKCFKNSFLHDRVFITHMRSPVVLCCYCFISFLTSCVPNETKYPSLSYFSNSLFNALENETATSKTNIMKTVYTHG